MFLHAARGDSDAFTYEPDVFKMSKKPLSTRSVCSRTCNHASA